MQKVRRRARYADDVTKADFVLGFAPFALFSRSHPLMGGLHRTHQDMVLSGETDLFRKLDILILCCKSVKKIQGFGIDNATEFRACLVRF